jgi:Tfp pilus assembly protein PilO
MNKDFLKNLLSRFSEREKFILYATVAVVSLVLVDRLIVGPVIDRIGYLNKQIDREKVLIKNTMLITSQKDKILKEIQKYNAFSVKSTTPEEEITSLLKEIENLANKSSVYLVNIKPKGAAENDFYKEYVVDLNCEAQMEQLIGFMHAIESSNKILKINEYNIAPKSRDSTTAVCRMTVSKLVIP